MFTPISLSPCCFFASARSVKPAFSFVVAMSADKPVLVSVASAAVVSLKETPSVEADADTSGIFFARSANVSTPSFWVRNSTSKTSSTSLT